MTILHGLAAILCSVLIFGILLLIVQPPLDAQFTDTSIVCLKTGPTPVMVLSHHASWQRWRYIVRAPSLETANIGEWELQECPRISP